MSLDARFITEFNWTYFFLPIKILIEMTHHYLNCANVNCVFGGSYCPWSPLKFIFFERHCLVLKYSTDLDGTGFMEMCYANKGTNNGNVFVHRCDIIIVLCVCVWEFEKWVERDPSQEGMRDKESKHEWAKSR